MIGTLDPASTVLPFPGATGRGVRVAVLDSGVNASHPHICATTHALVLHADAGASAEDEVGHGTAVTAAIQEKAPGAEYYAVKLFGVSLRTSTTLLMDAIEWCIEQRMDLVNLSLGTTRQDHRAPLQSLVDRANDAGVVLVAAAKAGEHPAYPGCLNGVLSVDVEWELPRHRYRFDQSRFYTSGFPRGLPGVSPQRNLNGISFAVANMTGFAARAYEGLTARSCHVLKAALEAESNRANHD